MWMLHSGTCYQLLCAASHLIALIISEGSSKPWALHLSGPLTEGQTLAARHQLHQQSDRTPRRAGTLIQRRRRKRRGYLGSGEGRVGVNRRSDPSQKWSCSCRSRFSKLSGWCYIAHSGYLKHVHIFVLSVNVVLCPDPPQSSIPSKNDRPSPIVSCAL
jgi:hypothetical protein